EGFVVFDYLERYPEAKAQIADWLKAGKVKAKEDVQEGIDRFPEVLNMLYTSKNFGKLVLKP
ncbi:MAG: NADP-dependent oxidoreductase, partial [Thermaurantiacus sp.]